MRAIRTVSQIIALLMCSAPFVAQGAEELLVPEKDVLAQKERLVRDLYKADLAKANSPAACD